MLSAQPSTHIVDFNRHGWYSYSGDHPVTARWGVHFDGQWRRAEVIAQWQQFQLRPGINFRPNPNLLLTLGYAYTRTYPYGEFPVLRAIPEHRIYQQAIVRQPFKRAIISHRIRMEQRFIRYPNTADRTWTYQNRFRYMLRTAFPLSERWYIPIFDEVLIGLPPNYGARPFDQNRLFAGIGRSLGDAGRIETGYMNQFLGQRNGLIFEFNHTLFVTFTSTYPIRKLFSK